MRRTDVVPLGCVGLGTGGVVMIIMLSFKVAGLISWPWWVVFAPVLLPMGVVMTLLAGIGLGYSMMLLWSMLMALQEARRFHEAKRRAALRARFPYLH